MNIPANPNLSRPNLVQALIRGNN